MLERLHRRATKMIPKHKDISYEMRLKECGLTTRGYLGMTTLRKL